ncbi:hypothetical protein BASA50_003658 [Batrachochytrium salamandrivorans]|uniref:Uncharacterized protein n=1 Tax=Batrachochytrium salamandrivorans TaxID=1357716 RepID=A0ABQ8FI33_9FUNG|nr:hypothetical protein BASA60_003348 [Batrachochytrium salamandrivorans]KAH6598622.1 hypothetical protein BASA50_003658 [Batrachochytrium salamandrivorans]KAH6600798.1 hypothetical protein BASA61_002216 [Batrachochytrium salamandrivorans]
MASTTRYTRFSSVSLSASVIAGLLCMAPIGTSAATEWSLWKDPQCTAGTPLVSKVTEGQCHDVAVFCAAIGISPDMCEQKTSALNIKSFSVSTGPKDLLLKSYNCMGCAESSDCIPSTYNIPCSQCLPTALFTQDMKSPSITISCDSTLAAAAAEAASKTAAPTAAASSDTAATTKSGEERVFPILSLGLFVATLLSPLVMIF